MQLMAWCDECHAEVVVLGQGTLSCGHGEISLRIPLKNPPDSVEPSVGPPKNPPDEDEPGPPTSDFDEGNSSGG